MDVSLKCSGTIDVLIESGNIPEIHLSLDGLNDQVSFRRFSLNIFKSVIHCFAMDRAEKLIPLMPSSRHKFWNDIATNDGSTDLVESFE